MGNIKLLDCTLRDGGYINDWNFGEKNIEDIISNLEQSRIDILEIGFLKNEPYQKDRTVYNQVEQISKQIQSKKKEITYSAMIEVLNPVSLEEISPRSEETVDMIRVIIWKRLLKEGFEYCRGIVEKGYLLSVQPARVDQYTDDEFIDMIKLFNTINPMAFYIVDSWGTQTEKTLLSYAQLAEQYLKPQIAIGYHGHNNMQQAFQVAKVFCQLETQREIYIDSSIDGIGRGAGNLDTYTIAEYLNRKYNKEYKVSYFELILKQYIQPIFNIYPWGYTLPFHFCAIKNCNPNYAAYYDFELHLPVEDIKSIVETISSEDKIIFTKEKADRYLTEFRG